MIESATSGRGIGPLQSLTQESNERHGTFVFRPAPWLKAGGTGTRDA
jgi:hypothetical protein